jgi:adenine-specific DNA methylase
MNFIANESAQKLRGGYYTQLDVAAFLARWVMEAKPRRILEPACGDGAFFEALGRVEPAGVKTLIGCEIDAAEAARARCRAKPLRGVSATVHASDFLEWFLSQRAQRPEFDAAFGNPPFIRYQYLAAESQSRSEEIFREFGLRFTKHTNAWVPFIVASLGMLRPGGRLAMVVPSELLHVLHAGPLRGFLLRQCARVLVIDPEDIWFKGTLQGVVLLLAEKGQGGGKLADVAIQPIKDRAALSKPASEYLRAADFVPGRALSGKWMALLLTATERHLLATLEHHPGIRRFGDLASVDVGIVTGANKFFLVPDSVVLEHNLSPWAHPMFGRSEHVRGVVYDQASNERNRRAGLPANFLLFGEESLAELPAAVRRYLRQGEAQGLPRRYKCRIRTPWYRVPSVYATPVAMLKRCHHFPRLILNRAGAYTTDTAYRIKPRGLRPADLVVGFVNSLTALCCELEGRHYGGGVLELVPSEIEKVLVPVAKHAAARLQDLDKGIRAGMPAADVLTRQDRLVLKPLGLEEKEGEILAEAWARIKNRRQRATSLARY